MRAGFDAALRLRQLILRFGDNPALLGVHDHEAQQSVHVHVEAPAVGTDRGRPGRIGQRNGANDRMCPRVDHIDLLVEAGWHALLAHVFDGAFAPIIGAEVHPPSIGGANHVVRHSVRIEPGHDALLHGVEHFVLPVSHHGDVDVSSIRSHFDFVGTLSQARILRLDLVGSRVDDRQGVFTLVGHVEHVLRRRRRDPMGLLTHFDRPYDLIGLHIYDRHIVRKTVQYVELRLRDCAR